MNLPSWLKGLDSKYRLGTILFLITLVVCVFSFRESMRLSRENDALELERVELQERISRLKSKVEDYEGCRNPTPSYNSPLRINFTDGRLARVSYHASYRPVWEKYLNPSEPEVDEAIHQLLQNQSERLTNFLQSTIYSELEMVTFRYATGNRPEISQRILDKVKPSYEKLDFEIMEVNLGEICEVQVLMERTN